MIKASEVKQIINKAGFHLNSHAKVYIGGLDYAEYVYGENGVKNQILYILTNIRAKGKEQRAVKKRLRRMAA